MNLDRVTITGADDSIAPADLIPLSMRYPFVEWGILLSRSQEGGPRFPSLDWMLKLAHLPGGEGLRLSGHLCGSWVRALCRGQQTFLAERPGIARIFQRAQLNFHAQAHDVNEGLFLECLRHWGREEYIFQFDDVNNLMIGAAMFGGIRAVPLFDTSGGAGIEPGSWPSPIGDYCGYAGGLHPDRIGAQLDRIEAAAGASRIWIDVETHVRSDNDAVFDLAKVERFLAAVAPRVGVAPAHQGEGATK